MRIHGDDETHGADQDPGNEGADRSSDEELELWLRNPVTSFRAELAYKPEKVYTDPQGQTRLYDKMWTGEWWWETQSRLPAGATVAPVILASDKTQLSRFKGNKVAWPVYLTIGNISKEVRRQSGSHASILLGYIPVSKVDTDTFENNSPLVAAGREGLETVCTDRRIRRVHPILAAFIGDHPEQCLVACCAENRCPKCHVPADQHGANTQFPPCNQEQTAHVLHAQASGQYPPEFVAEGLRPIFSPFWADLPHTNIFMGITSDILHQLHQGLFKDHLKKRFDSWFRAMPIHPGLRHFKEGISKITQWTGADNKQLQRVFVTVLVGTTPNHDVVRASRALLDFISLAQYRSHTDNTLRGLQHALNEFHALKNVFIDLGCREHFNLPKFHSLCHYMNSIKLYGSLDGFNTENSERLHIDYAKKAYAASNQKDYMIQMTRWLSRQEAVMWFKMYLTWRLGGSPKDYSKSASEYSGDSDAGSGARPNQALTLTAPYHIALHPHFPKRSVPYLIQNHGASFLATIGPRGDHTFQPTPHDRFDCFSNLRIPLAPSEHSCDNDMAQICSHPERANGPRKPPTAARWDTVLVQVDKEQRNKGGFRGLRAAEVRVIFRLPPHLGLLPHPLAYIHWFKPLCAFNEDVKMFCFGRSTRNHLPNAAVVPVTHLVQPCHLVPRFPSGAVDPHWINRDVMTAADSFYLNSIKYIAIKNFY
ncbi:hypothetical protein OG21DRAFT_1478799 [Imleria badia]|nr:hypothetical protein OG21DRAFT_1478799 [Imleria badia]